jgi:phytoene dehydrogenase-like protein
LQTYDNIVIGGGISGLICGGYLAKAGQKTLILESRETSGGRIVSPIDSFDGYKVHVHGITHHPTMGKEGWWFAAANDLGAKIKMQIVPPGAAIWFRGQGIVFKYLPRHSNLEGMIQIAVEQSREPFTEASKQELRKILEEILNMNFMRMCADLDTVFLEDWLNERTHNPQIHFYFFNLYCQMINLDMVDAKRHGGAGKFFTLFRQWLAREGNFGITTEGTLYSDLIKPFQDAFLSHGGELKCHSTVSKVIVRNDKAVGVVLAGKKGEEYRARRVIVSTPFTSIPRLFDRLPEEISDRVRDMEKAWYVDIVTYSALSRSVTDEPRFIAAQDPADWSFLLGLAAISAFRPWTAPPGKHLVWSERGLRKQDFHPAKLQEQYDLIDKITEEVYPGYTEAVEAKHRTIHPLLWHHQYSAYRKIPQKPKSLQGLYFIGDGTTPQYGQGGDGSASTGVILAQRLLDGLYE